MVEIRGRAIWVIVHATLVQLERLWAAIDCDSEWSNSRDSRLKSGFILGHCSEPFSRCYNFGRIELADARNASVWVIGIGHDASL